MEQPRKRKRTKNRLPMIVFAFVVIVTLFLALPYINELVDIKSSEGDIVTVTIPKGASTEQIGEILKENKLIKSVNIFKLRAHFSENGARMNYGTFKLNDGMCIPDIVNTLAGTYTLKSTITLTVPEGFSVEQIGALCESLGLCSKAEFLEALNEDYGLNVTKPEGARYALQGYLYPETYEFYQDATAHDIIKRMTEQFTKEMKAAGIKTGKDFEKTLVMASLIEREALLDSEMPKISGVIHNRLEKGMRLQVDAAVQYAVSDGMYNVDRILYRHLEIDSPYNTYKIDALPVAPICNPSIEAIQAALKPEKHEYLYYHTDTVKNDGSHIFTKSYEEHIKTQ